MLGREANRAGLLVASLLEAARIASGLNLLDEPANPSDPAPIHVKWFTLVAEVIADGPSER